MPDKRKFLVDYTELDKLPGWMWDNGKPTLLPVINKDFTPELYIQDALQFAKKHPGEQLTYLNPIVIKPFDGKIFDRANFIGGKRVNKLIDSQGRVIFENKTGKRLRDLIEVNYKGGKGYVDWNPLTDEKKLVAYLLPNDLYPRTLPEGYDVNPIEEEWNLQHNINYLNWSEDLRNKPKVTTDSFKPSNSRFGRTIAGLMGGLMTLPVLEATGVAENLTKVVAPYITKGINYFKNFRTPSSMTLYGPGYGTATKSIGRKVAEQALASTAGFEGMNLVSKSVTGKNWGDALRNILPDGPTWMPEWGKLMLADGTNPGGWASPNTFYNAYNTLANKLSNVVTRSYKNSILYPRKEHVTRKPKLLNNWLYNIADDIKDLVKNTKNLSKDVAYILENNYQNQTLKKIPVPSEFKTYLHPTLQRIPSSLRSYIESIIPDVYLETDNLLSGKNTFGYWDRNFIKLRKTTPKNHSKPNMFSHEARHAIDAEVLNVLTKDQINMINDAYDWDDLDLVPGYDGMNKEKVTTNLDARNLLFDSYHDKNIRNYSVDQQNQIIDSYSDQAIVDFVQKSNGYGRRYINYLKKNNKLTPEKISKFREAMKYVPILGGFTFLNQNNQ